MDRVVILVDWENVRQSAEAIFKKNSVDESEAKRKLHFGLDFHIYNLCVSFIDREGEYGNKEVLTRLLIYTAWDLEKGAQKFFEEMKEQGEAEATYVQKFLSAFERTEKVMGHLRKRRNVTLRRGVIGYKTIHIGDKKYGVPIQKRVDMLMGIDMVTYAYSGRIDKVILFLNDQDVIPAVKEVKRRGINVVLATFKELLDDKKVSVHLIEHCDEIRIISLLDLNQGKGDVKIAYSEELN